MHYQPDPWEFRHFGRTSQRPVVIVDFAQRARAFRRVAEAIRTGAEKLPDDHFERGLMLAEADRYEMLARVNDQAARS